MLEHKRGREYMNDIAGERLETKRLVLRHALLADAQAIFDAYASDPEATRYLVFATLTNVTQAREYIERTLRERKEGKSVTWVIVLRDTQQVIGAIDLHADGSIGYAIGRPWWGSGYVPEAARAVLDFARAHLGVKRIMGICDYENVRSARVFEKLGFRSLGLKERAVVHPAFGQEPRAVLRFECDL